MTTTETAREHVSPDEQQPVRRGSLLRAETRRFTSRRFIRLLVLLATVGYLGVTVAVGMTQFAKADGAAMAEAEATAQQVFDESTTYYEQCRNDEANVPDGVPVEDYCGQPPRRQDFPASQFLSTPPFELREALPAVAIAVGVGTAMLGFLLGATFVGAEWSSRSMVALLFWEPRRLRVMGVKLLVTAAAAALLAVLAQASWVAMAEVLARTRGNRDGLEPDFWGDLVAQQARAVLFVVVVALLGFGLANLTRNTGAALGVGFVYFAVVESAVRGFWPSGQQFLFTDNAAALLLQGTYRIHIYDEVITADGQFMQTDRVIELSNLHGGLFVSLVTAAVVGAGVVLFKRRDLH